MKDLFVPIDKAGRVVLPKSIRDDLSINPGDLLKISVHGNAMTLEAKSQPSGLVRKGKALVFSNAANELLTHETVQALLDEDRGDRSVRSVAQRLPSRRK